MKRFLPCLLITLVAVLALSGCAAGNPMYSQPSPAGFWAGLWHGMIIVFTFIISLFDPTVDIYEIHNNGGWYDFGFFLGIGGPSCGSEAVSRWRSGRDDSDSDLHARG